MRTVDFSTLMYRWMQLAGLDRTAITALNFNTFRDLANNRIEQIWENDYWPDLVRVSSPQTVLVDGNGVRTVTLPADSGELLNVYDQDPRLTTRSRSMKYFLYSSATTDYANLMEDTTPVYLEYKTRPPNLFGDAYSATVAYYVGAQAYFDTSTDSGSYLPNTAKLPAGNFYTCTVATSAGQSPTTTPNSWTKIDLPQFTTDFLTRATLADYLRSEGQFDQAMVAEGDSNSALEREVDRVVRAQGQVRRADVFTY